MKTIVYLYLTLLIVAIKGFQITPRKTVRFSRIRRITIRSNEHEPNIQLESNSDAAAIPIEPQNIQNAAALASGILGLVYGGPVTAITLAGASKFAAKQNEENDLGNAVRGVGRTLLEAYNFMNRVNTKYGITNTISESFELTVNAIAEEAPVVDTIKKSCISAMENLDKVNRDYGIVEKGTQVIVGAADLSEIAIEKSFELNEKFDLMGKLESLANSAIMTLRPNSFPQPSSVNAVTLTPNSDTPDNSSVHSDSSVAVAEEKEEAMKYFKDIFNAQSETESPNQTTSSIDDLSN